MSIIPQKHSIQVTEYITQEEYNLINQLMELCCEQESINLKLELDYKLHLGNLADNRETATGSKREFLYFIGNTLVAYLGISCFDGVTGELCGMTHPMYRKQGIFHRLLALALNECQHSNFKQLLILADGNSESGMNFIRAITSNYAHSEYRMKRLSASASQLTNNSERLTNEAVTLRPASKTDEKKLSQFNAILFNEKDLTEEDGEYYMSTLEEQPENQKTYMIDFNGSSIGKINVEYNGQYAFLFGFGIIPEYRGKGYGRMGLTETLRLIEAQGVTVIELDVVCTNKNALGLYQSCGFVEQSVMNYYNLR